MPGDIESGGRKDELRFTLTKSAFAISMPYCQEKNHRWPSVAMPCVRYRPVKEPGGPCRKNFRSSTSSQLGLRSAACADKWHVPQSANSNAHRFGVTVGISRQLI